MGEIVEEWKFGLTPRTRLSNERDAERLSQNSLESSLLMKFCSSFRMKLARKLDLELRVRGPATNQQDR